MTTGRINQVAHNRIVLKQRAQIRKSFWQLFRKITAIRKLQLEHFTYLSTSNLRNCRASSAVFKSPRELHHTWTHICIISETKSQKGYGCPETVPRHTLLITREKKNCPKTDDFQSLVHTKPKKKPMCISKQKMPLVDNCIKKIKVGESGGSEILTPRLRTPVNSHNRSSKGGNRKNQIWTELCRLNPGGSIVRERFKFNFFCLSRTTSWPRRSHRKSTQTGRHNIQTRNRHT